jgi:hypothetical protein
MPNDAIQVRVKILSGPQVCFPFPGCPEVNVVAELLGALDSSKDDELPMEKILAVLAYDAVPELGSEVVATLYPSFYIAAREHIPDGLPKWRISYSAEKAALVPA